jgi:hypothetical protein
VVAYKQIEKVGEALNAHETKWLLRLRVLLLYTFVMFVILVIERYFCYTVYANAYLNETVESVVEWILVACGIIAPAFFA